MDYAHSLLKRQVKRHLGSESRVPAEVLALIEAVDAAYIGFDEDREMLERSLELSSNELVQTNSEMRAIFQAIPDLLFRIDFNGTILDFKGGSSSDLLLDAKNMIGRRIQDVPVEGVRKRFAEGIRRVLLEKSAVSIEYTLPLRDGECYYEARFVPLLSDQIVVIVRNITARKRAEDIRDSQNRMLEMIATGAALDEALEKLVREVESQAPEMLCSILLLDKSKTRLRHGAAPSLPKGFSQFVDGVAIGPTAGSCGTAAFRKEAVFVSDVLTDPLWADFRDLAVRHGLRACWSLPILSIRGEVLGTFAAYYREPRSPEPADVQLIETASHIARIAIERQVAAEALKKTEEQFREAQKMQAFGQLAGGVAHDFNNILTVIIAGASMLQNDDLKPEERAESLDQIATAAERAAGLTRQLLTFSRRQPVDRRNVDLNGVVTEMTAMLKRLIGEHIELEEKCVPGGAPVRADLGMMEQVLMNLAVNARDAMPKGGKLTIATHVLLVGAEQSVRPGRYVRLSVGDTGVGIPPEHIPHIFEPFFTTKDVGKGTGLGLATVYGIVEQHEGWIETKSEVGKGTVFEVFLPLSLERPDAAAGSVTTGRVSGGTECILLVEDEHFVRKLMRTILTKKGYRVIDCANPIEARQIWSRQKDEIDLLVTDLVMPGGVSGRGLADSLCQERKTLKVVYCSGYSDEILGSDAAIRRSINFVAKPFDSQIFLRTVRNCLNSAPSTVAPREG